MKKERILIISFLLPVVAFLIIFFYWPLSKLIVIALDSSLLIWKETFQNPLFSRFILFTFIQTIFTIIGTLVIGLPSGYLLARTRPYGIKFLRAAITVPFLFPPLVILLGFVVLFEPNGILSDFFQGWSFSPFSFWGIVGAHILYNISVVARITEAGFAGEPVEYLQLADTLGASWLQKFKSITFPYLRPSLESAVLLVFLYSFNSFAIVLILGEVRLQTIEVMIYNQSRLRFNFNQASILAFFQLIINLCVIIYYSTRKKYERLDDTGLSVPPSNQRILPTLLLSLVVIITWAPVLIIFEISLNGLINAPDFFQSQLLSGVYDRYLGTSSLRVIINTLFFGVVVSILAVIFSGLMVVTSSIEKKLDLERFYLPLTLLPMGTSAITLSFALLLTHGNFSLFSDLVWMYIIAAQVMAALPFSARALYSSWQQVPQDLILVSETLGAGYYQIYREVILPYLKSGFFIAFLFSFAISIGEFGATFYLVRGEWTTLSLAIDRLFSSRNALLPNLYASLLVVTALVIFWLIENLGTLELKL